MKIRIISENDNILSEELKLHLSRKLYKNLKARNITIFVNDSPLETYKRINKGDIITFDYSNTHEINWELYESKIDIIYENDNYLVVNKRKDLLCIPTKAEPKSLYQEVLYYLNNKGEDLTISIINRLDKETEGLCLIAKNRFAANIMSPIHEKMERRYLCLNEGIIEKDSGVIDNYIAKGIETNKRYITDDSNIGKRAISNYKVIKKFGNYTLTEFKLETGRTHQIRLHSKTIGHPIKGDKLYNNGDGNLYLCSYYLKYYDYVLEKELEFSIKPSWIKNAYILMYERLESKNIIIRKSKETDYLSMLNVWGDEEVYKWMLFTPTKTIDEAKDRLKRSFEYQKNNFAYFICLKDTDEAIGTCGIREYEPNRIEEMGICISTKYQGLGYGKEVLSLLLDLAFMKLNAKDFRYGYFIDNIKSKKLALSFGFKYYETEELIRPWDNEKKVVDLCLLTKDEYLKGVK